MGTQYHSGNRFGEYYFLTNTVDSIETDLVEVPSDIQELPEISHYGTVHSLHQAMARESLKCA